MRHPLHDSAVGQIGQIRLQVQKLMFLGHFDHFGSKLFGRRRDHEGGGGVVGLASHLAGPDEGAAAAGVGLALLGRLADTSTSMLLMALALA